MAKEIHHRCPECDRLVALIHAHRLACRPSLRSEADEVLYSQTAARNPEEDIAAQLRRRYEEYYAPIDGY